MRDVDQAREEARRVANGPTGDRLDGKLGDEAEQAVVRMMEVAGLTYPEGLKLVSAVYWSGWASGFASGKSVTTKEN